MDSILDSIKKMLGLDVSYTPFDVDIMVNINAVFSILNQLGIGESGFVISGSEETWSDFLGDN